ncbi:ras-related protein Rab-7b-like [Pristis pectinata]|uniref:ras-related protein Rab-7b-like n=1 Tax=Pristis pectinata TaxID=685728 RepID=UPI00223DD273|nr:ras-related protein Rab-7b-like [Pristis pectinata]XP_051890676.1 ras-related protein Rab-7b-like [Pristis pectinata]XP_051890677.1 ras-related protein Rab-7b-like [Pristis pectinata]
MNSNKTESLKIVIIGSMDVGKTALLNRYVNNRFRDEYQTTLGVNVLTKQITVDDVAVKLQIWDTGGQERFKALVSSFFKGSDGCVLVFDVTDRDTFYAMEGWRNEVLARVPTAQNDFPFMVLGNKVDKEPVREVTSEEAEVWCNARNIPYYEVSAKEGMNVDKAFESMARIALSQIAEGKDLYLTNSISLEDHNGTERQKCC